MITYKLLTPGPLTTTETVKKEMLVDHCTWDDDYKQITQSIRKTLLKLAHVSPEEYTAVLMQGSGTFGVESVLTSAVSAQDKLLIIANGAYGQRMAEIAHRAGLSHQLYNCSSSPLRRSIWRGRSASTGSRITLWRGCPGRTAGGLWSWRSSICRRAMRKTRTPTPTALRWGRCS